MGPREVFFGEEHLIKTNLVEYDDCNVQTKLKRHWKPNKYFLILNVLHEKTVCPGAVDAINDAGILHL
jgi:hypothetical protein